MVPQGALCDCVLRPPIRRNSPPHILSLEAVIDKDFASALLANRLGAHRLASACVGGACAKPTRLAPLHK